MMVGRRAMTVFYGAATFLKKAAPFSLEELCVAIESSLRPFWS